MHEINSGRLRKVTMTNEQYANVSHAACKVRQLENYEGINPKHSECDILGVADAEIWDNDARRLGLIERSKRGRV